MDLECGEFFNLFLEHAVDKNAVSIAMLDEALTNAFTVQVVIVVYKFRLH